MFNLSRWKHSCFQVLCLSLCCDCSDFFLVFLSQSALFQLALAYFQGRCYHNKISFLSNILESLDKYMRERTDISAEGLALASHIVEMEGPSDKLFCCRWVRLRVSLAHREELYHILRMAGPLVRIGTVYIPLTVCKALCGFRQSLLRHWFIKQKIDECFFAKEKFKEPGKQTFLSETQKQKSIGLKQCLAGFSLWLNSGCNLPKSQQCDSPFAKTYSSLRP